MSEACPSCGTHPLGTSFVVILTARGGTEFEAIVCGECGTVYVEEPDDTIHQAIIDEVADGEEGDDV